MRIAVPIFGNDVAPRFSYTRSFLVAEVADERIVHFDNVNLEFSSWPDLLGQLRDLGVDTILCGGFNRCFTPLAETLGLTVHAGLGGNAHQVVEAFARGEETSNSPRGMGRKRRSRLGRNKQWGPGRRRGKQNNSQ